MRLMVFQNGLRLSFIIFTLIIPLQLKGEVIERVLVVIDGEPYTLSNIKEFSKTKMNRVFPTADLNQIANPDKEVLELFITEKLIAAETQRLGIRVSDQSIDRYIKTVKEQAKLSDEDLKEVLRRDGLTMEEYRKSIRAQIEKSELINAQVTKKVNITPEDIERYYNQNKKKYMTDDRIHLRHILILVPKGATRSQDEAALSKITEVRNMAIAGEPFAILARQYSEGPAAYDGGDIGWVEKGSLLPTIEYEAFHNLSVGMISQPIRTHLGYHLIKLEERDKASPMPLSEVSEKIKAELQAKAMDERFQKWLKTDLRKKHRVDVKVAGVVFEPEESKEGTVDSLIASASDGEEEKSFWSYLNPLTYIISKEPIEGEDGEFGDEKVISVFGLPLGVTDDVDTVSDKELEEILKKPPAASSSKSENP